MNEWIGPTGGSRVRVDTCVGSLLKEQWNQRVQWAEQGDPGRIIVRMDATAVTFPERNSGQLLFVEYTAGLLLQSSSMY